MVIDKHRVLAQIALQPKIRSVEIADAMDCEAEMIDRCLAPEIAAGDVKVLRAFAPNGRPVSGFEFSEAFVRTAAYGAIAAAAGIDAAPLPPVAATVAPPAVARPVPAPKTRPAAVPGTATEPPMTYFDKAIAFIRSNGGRVDNESLREALGLGIGASPISYLRLPTNDGRLKRVGRDWLLGERAAATPRYKAGLAVPRALKPPVDVQSPFRCAIWSDGMMELQRAGQTIAILAPAEQAALSALLAG
ncbi:hypothetical protein HSX11_01635 [Oxalobacteraceae bacterium]|nr:hypothetical protein [Oxalobacteraceae bacterium]